VFKKLIASLTGSKRPDPRAIYAETRAYLEEKLVPLGFTKTKEEDYAIGAVLLYSKRNLEAGLVLDVREAECVFRAESGNVRKQVDGNGHIISEIFDVYLPLAGTDSSQAEFREALENWLLEFNG